VPDFSKALVRGQPLSKYSRIFCTAALCLASLLVFNESAIAQRVTTNATFTSPVQVSGLLLPAGSYQFSIARDRRSVVVSQSDGRVIKTIEVVPITRAKPGQTVNLSSPVNGAVPEVSSVFSGGGTAGVEFINRNAPK